jgi:hypothetical protein
VIDKTQQGEPVAWRIWSPDGTNVYQYTENGDGEPLFTHPAPREPMTPEKVRAVGGIVHSDGNVFFTNMAQLNEAIGIKEKSE